MLYRRRPAGNPEPSTQRPGVAGETLKLTWFCDPKPWRGIRTYPGASVLGEERGEADRAPIEAKPTSQPQLAVP
jgi:hypothetical protein